MSKERKALGGVRAEENLRQMEEAYRKLFDLSPAGVMIIEEDGAIRLVSPATVRLLGHQDENALLGQNLFDLMDPEHLAHCLDCLKAAFEGESPRVEAETVLIRADGEHFPCEVVAGPFTWQGRPACQVIVRDITEEKRAAERLIHLADCDPLTDLLNRRRFGAEVNHLLATKRSGRSGAVLLLDLDGFSDVNYGLGHEAGDEVLKQVAATLRDGKRKTDALSRVSGDKYALLLPETDVWRTQSIAQRTLEKIRNQTFQAAGQEIHLTASIGIAFLHEHGGSSEDLLSRADLALHQSKEKGGNVFSVFMPEENWQEQVNSRLAWQLRMREALDNDSFILHAQPIRDLRSGATAHYELLLRLADGDGVASADAFIPIAEKSDLIRQIDRWVVEQAIRLIAEHRDAGRTLVLHANVSGKGVKESDLLAPVIRALLETASIDPQNLVLEITETAATANMDDTRKFVRAVKALGCRVALDDFGVGFSSFSQLKHLAVDMLKIDGSFIRDLVNSSTDQTLVQAMVDVARGLGMKTTAEYVSGPATVDLLRKLGVDFAQGYHIGEPQDVSRVLVVPAKVGQRAA